MQAEPQSTHQRFGQTLADQLVHKAQAGDMAAHSEIYRLYSKAVMSLACGFCRDSHAAEDVVHNTFVKLIDKIELFEFRAPFGLWLRQIAVNESLMYLRKQKKQNHVSSDDESYCIRDRDTVEGVAFFAQWEDPAEQQGVKLDLGDVLLQLPEHVRLILWLKEIEGYTHTEIAALVDKTPSYSKSIVARAFIFLKKRVSASDPITMIDALN